jgi:hypothetical protein
MKKLYYSPFIVFMFFSVSPSKAMNQPPLMVRGEIMLADNKANSTICYNPFDARLKGEPLDTVYARVKIHYRDIRIWFHTIIPAFFLFTAHTGSLIEYEDKAEGEEFYKGLFRCSVNPGMKGATFQEQLTKAIKKFIATPLRKAELLNTTYEELCWYYNSLIESEHLILADKKEIEKNGVMVWQPVTCIHGPQGYKSENHFFHKMVEIISQTPHRITMIQELSKECRGYSDGSLVRYIAEREIGVKKMDIKNISS